MDYAEQYGAMHAKGKYFPGYSIQPYVDAIARLVVEHGPVERLLDFGSGRGLQYLKRRVHEQWGGILPHCYDIGVRGLDELPEGRFDGVLCTDVLEHIERADIPATLDLLLDRADAFLFAVISCRPTRKKLPDGRDVHVTIEPPSWWASQIHAAGIRKGDRAVHVVAHFDVMGHFAEPEHPLDIRV